ncbi:MAG: HAD hydrolase family protein [bacterium]|nr:HAD hydrolase family protein [bacterium]
MKFYKKKLPPIGMRIFKSFFGVFLGFVIYFLRGRQGTPFYTALSVLWCIRAYTKDTKLMALQRTIGTFLGGFFGLIMIMFELHSGFHYGEFVRYTLISLLIIPLIYTTVLLDRKNASYFACVVYLSIAVLHITDENPYIFVMNRVIDTLVGIGIALVLETYHLPKRRDTETLFVSGIDNTLISTTQALTAYSKVELNRMLDNGANFTVASMRTPASIVEAMKDVRLKLPVIAMNGAVLFDTNENHYLNKQEIPFEDARKIVSFIEEKGYNVFKNVVIEDMWAIYYKELTNKAEQEIFGTLRKSPYRNYIKSELPKNQNVVYFMLVDTSERIEQIYLELQREGYADAYRMIKYESSQYAGFSYIKIYEKEATKENMLRYLTEQIGINKVMTFGSVEGKSDFVVSGDNPNEVVRTLKRQFEQSVFSKKKTK